MKDTTTKKPSSRQSIPEMKTEYDFSGGVRGKYAGAYRQGTNFVLTEPVLTDAVKTGPDYLPK